MKKFSIDFSEDELAEVHQMLYRSIQEFYDEPGPEDLDECRARHALLRGLAEALEVDFDHCVSEDTTPFEQRRVKMILDGATDWSVINALR